MIDFELEYRGYKYQPWDDVEEDNVKRFHDVKAPDGSNLSLPLSPYHTSVSIEYFQLWVDAGCPYPRSQRVTIDELRELAFTKITEDQLANISPV